LYAIAKVESGMNPHAVGWNHDGTRDVGLMQINSSHFSELERQGLMKISLLMSPVPPLWSAHPFCPG
jgi:soluble lytic murein transglycosylase-like protein